MQNFRRCVGLHQLPRRKVLAAILRYRIVDPGLFFRAAEREPGHMQIAASVSSNRGTGMRTGGHLPTVIADFYRFAKCLAAVRRFMQRMVTNLLLAYLPIGDVNCFSAVRESDAQSAALAKPAANLIAARQLVTLHAEPLQVKRTRYRVIDSSVDPTDQQRIVRRGFDDRKPSGIFQFV